MRDHYLFIRQLQPVSLGRQQLDDFGILTSVF